MIAVEHLNHLHCTALAYIVGKSVFASGNRFFEAQLSEF